MGWLKHPLPFLWSWVRFPGLNEIEVFQNIETETNVSCWTHHRPKRCLGIWRSRNGWMEAWMDGRMSERRHMMLSLVPLVSLLYCHTIWSKYVELLLCILVKQTDCVLSVKDPYEQSDCCLMSWLSVLFSLFLRCTVHYSSTVSCCIETQSGL